MLQGISSPQFMKHFAISMQLVLLSPTMEMEKLKVIHFVFKLDPILYMNYSFVNGLDGEMEIQLSKDLVLDAFYSNFYSLLHPRAKTKT